MITIYDTLNNDEIFTIEEICNQIDNDNAYLLVGTGNTWNHQGNIYIAGETLEEAVSQLIENCTDIKIETNDNKTEYEITAYHHDGQYHVKAIKLPSMIFDEYESWRDGYPSIYDRFETEAEFWQEILKLI